VRAALIATVIGAALAAPATAAATPAQDLARARDAFRKGDYQVAIPLLNYLLYPSPRLAQTSDLVEAHVLFAVCAYETGDRLTAAREFEEALFLQADLELDGNALFSRRALAEERERLRRYRESLIVYEVRPYYVNFIPFGAGQFQNGDRKKGLAFAAGQAITGGVSAGIWLYLVGEYGIGGAVPRDELGRARRLQEIEVGAGIACLGLVAWGVVDSLLHYKPRVQVSGDDSLLPDDLVPKAGPGKRPAPRPPAPPAEKPPSTLRFAPVPLPGGAGAALTWEF
jgi:hypothetical protein